MAYYFTFCLFLSQTTFPLYSHSFYISEPSPRRVLQKPYWDSIFKQNPHLVTLTISRVVVCDQNSLQKYLQNDCEPFEAPLGGVAARGVWHWALQQSPDWDFCLTHGLLSSLRRWLLSKETPKPPGRSPSNPRVSSFCHIRWPLAENARDQRSLQCPGSIYRLEKYLDALVYPSVTAPM